MLRHEDGVACFYFNLFDVIWTLFFCPREDFFWLSLQDAGRDRGGMPSTDFSNAFGGRER